MKSDFGERVGKVCGDCLKLSHAALIRPVALPKGTVPALTEIPTLGAATPAIPRENNALVNDPGH